jgi:REP element-mobilizing transposase RayT
MVVKTGWGNAREKSQIDAPGALHHIICRGIERTTIFIDDADRDDFVSRFTTILESTGTRCYAWALLPNHFHFPRISLEFPPLFLHS